METKSYYTVSTGIRLHVEITFPKMIEEELEKIVIIATGDGKSGSKSGTWRTLIPALLKENIGVVSFDFFGLGESGGDYENLSLTLGIENLLSVIEVIKVSGIKYKKIGVVGASFGGCVALIVGSLYEKFDFMVLKSPASSLYEAYENEQKYFENMLQWSRTGISPVTKQKYNVYLDTFKYNVYGMIDQLHSKTLIIHGDNDQIVPIQQSLRLVNLNKEIQMKILDGVDHDYMQNDAMKKFVEYTIKFIKEHC